MLLTLLIMAGAAALVALVVALQQRSQPGAPTAARDEPPTSLDRSDFRSPQSEWLIAVFTSATCASCAAVVAELRGFGSSQVVVVEVEVGSDPELHRKYAIGSVPTAVVAARDGDARLGIVGPIGPDHRAALSETLARGPASGELDGNA